MTHSTEAHPFQPKQGGKRWYDNDPRATWAIELIIDFPQSIQHDLCDGLLTLMANLRDHRETYDSCKTLGREGVIALYQAQKRRRHYDSNQKTFQTLSYMSILHRDDQRVMVDHIANLALIIQLTIEQHGRDNLHGLQRHLRKVIALYVNDGQKASYHWLNHEMKQHPIDAKRPALVPASELPPYQNVSKNKGLHTR